MSIVDKIKLQIKLHVSPKAFEHVRSGVYPVGTTKLKLRSTVEPKSRTIVVQLWYPSHDGPSSRWTTWLFKLRHPTWASAGYNAPLTRALEQAPAIIYVPSSDHHDDNTFILANLASHGFIVAAISDPFRSYKSEPAKPLDASARRIGIEEASADYRNRCIARGVKTASMVLDALQELKHQGPRGTWADRIDPKRIGILGYALGGVVAAQTTLADRRYVAAANLAGELRGNTSLLTVPYLLMLSDASMKRNQPTVAAIKDRSTVAAFSTYHNAQLQAALPRSHIIEVAGATDEHFSDGAVTRARLCPGQQLPNYSRIRAIIDSYTVAFFSTYLQGTPHPLMHVRHSPYPEVRFLSPARVSLGPAS